MAAILEKAPLLQSTEPSEVVSSNGDFKQEADRVVVYTGVNGTNLGRQASTVAAGAFEGLSKIPRVPGALAALSGAVGMLNPALMIPSGLAILVSGAVWTIPDALDELEKAEREQERAKGNAKKEASRAVTVGMLGVGNHFLYTGMGGAMVASGAVGMCSTSALGYAPVLTGAAAATAAFACGLGLGGIYTLRGPIMLARSIMNLKMVREFHKEFTESEDKYAFIGAAMAKGDAYLGRRIDATCLTKKYPSNNKVVTYTHTEVIEKRTYVRISESSDLQILNHQEKGLQVVSNEYGTFISSDEHDVTCSDNLKKWFEGDQLINALKCVEKDKTTNIPMQAGNVRFTESGPILEVTDRHPHTPADKIEYLRRIDMAISSMIMKFEIGWKIGLAMFLGGIATIVAAVLTGGIALLVIGVVAAIFFIYMERTFLTYDNPGMFEKYRAKNYKEPAWLKSGPAPAAI